jgi:hypothetical protein
MCFLRLKIVLNKGGSWLSNKIAECILRGGKIIQEYYAYETVAKSFLARHLNLLVARPIKHLKELL